MVPKDDKSSWPDLKLVPSSEELEQQEELAAGHPWQLTLAQFLRKVVSEYGFQLCSEDVRDSAGNRVHLPYLKDPAAGRVVHLPGSLSLEDQLDPVVTGSLCRRLRIPEEDFGLLPEEPSKGNPNLN